MTAAHVSHPAHQDGSPADVLREALAAGPTASRDVLALLGAKGLTPKQLRRARERLGVVVERSGSGKSMRSVWRLPEAGERLDGGADPDRSRRAREAKSQGAAKPPSVVAPVLATDALTEWESSRVARRISVFMTRGVDHDKATSLALKLVHERDRTGRHDVGGSCIECQSYVRRECIVGPKALDAIHYCLYMRHDSP